MSADKTVPVSDASGAGILEGRSGQDPFLRGTEYLEKLRRLALRPEMIGLPEDIVERIRLCGWIGNNIEAVNRELEEYIEACHSCFHPENRPVIDIFAAPIAAEFGVDAFCNLALGPVAIVIDVGRIYRQDWLSVVAHEYAHAYLGSGGHQSEFLATISHLCLGLELMPPIVTGMDDQQRQAWLQNWPHCKPTPDPLAFWRGEL